MCEEVVVDKANWLKVLADPKIYSPATKARAVKYCKDNFNKIKENDDFLQMDIVEFKELFKGQSFTSDEEVFKCNKRWIQKNSVKPELALKTLMENVKLSELSTEFLTSEVISFVSDDKELLLKVSSELKERNNAVGVGGTVREVKKIPSSSKSDYKLLLSGYNYRDKYFYVQVYDSTTKKWSDPSKTSLTQNHSNVVLYNDKLIAIGGTLESKDDAPTKVSSIDLKDGTVSEMGELALKRRHPAVVVTGKDDSAAVYVIGGGDRNYKFYNEVEKWTEKNKKWEKVSHLNKKRSFCGAAVLDDLIYVAGGYEGAIEHDSLEVYDQKTNKWTLKAPMLEPRFCCTLASHNGFILAIGGFDKKHEYLQTVEIYEPSSDRWFVGANILKPSLVVACSAAGRLLVTGWNSAFDKEFQEFDESKSSWEKLASPNSDHFRSIIVEVPSSMSSYTFTF